MEEKGDGGREVPDEIGKRIRWQRKRRHMTLRQLAAGADLSFAFLCDVENGKKGLGFASAIRLARALGVSLAWLADE